VGITAGRRQPRIIRAIRVRQWLPEWDEVHYDPEVRRRRPEPHFYLFALPAWRLRALSGVHRRTAIAGRPRGEDPTIQRAHIEARSDEIARFISRAYPWSTLSKRQRTNPRFLDLAKPGWLVTPIVVNIVPPGVERNGLVLPESLAIRISPGEGPAATITLPKLPPDWDERGPGPFPLRVNDGQHRLLAVDSPDFDGDDTFEMTVVAFYDLDVVWEAGQFQSINVLPTRPNPSAVFDMYPILREESWLMRDVHQRTYDESVAVELAETWWAHPESPWHEYVDMRGEGDFPGVTLASCVRSLRATYVKPWASQGISVGGLFGGRAGAGPALGWSRTQQAAFLIFLWRAFRDAVSACDAEWAQRLRGGSFRAGRPDPPTRGAPPTPQKTQTRSTATASSPLKRGLARPAETVLSSTFRRRTSTSCLTTHQGSEPPIPTPSVSRTTTAWLSMQSPVPAGRPSFTGWRWPAQRLSGHNPAPVAGTVSWETAPMVSP
jgi:hypothetical protein